MSELSIIISSALQAAARARVRQFRLFVVKRRPIRTRHVLSPRGGRPRSLHPRAAAARDRDLGGLKTPSPHMRHAPRLDGATLSRGGGGGAAPFRRPPDPSAADDHRLLSARRAAAVSERRRRTSRGRRLGRAFVVPTAGPRVVVVACHRVFFFGRRGFGRPAGALPGALPRSPARARRRERTSRGCSTHATEWHSDSWLPTETIVGSAALTFSIQFMKPRARGARRAARGARDKRGGRDEQSEVRRASRQHTHRASDERSKERDARRDDRSRDPIREVRLRRRDDGLERNRARRPSPLSKTPPLSFALLDGVRLCGRTAVCVLVRVVLVREVPSSSSRCYMTHDALHRPLARGRTVVRVLVREVQQVAHVHERVVGVRDVADDPEVVDRRRVGEPAEAAAREARGVRRVPFAYICIYIYNIYIYNNVYIYTRVYICI